ncbi:MAG TPA: hypothetical protein VHR41_05000 [Gemmatimonadales bacterium]|jgi:hypothetical protein|nr:hypothetical protein [Gemmatimonadales bacterium]
MDPAFLIPVTAIAVWGAVKIAKIKAQSRIAGGDPDATARLQALEQEVGALRQDIVEAQERLDFTERLLAQHNPDRIDPPR